MSYLFKPYDGEIKNDVGNPLPISKDINDNSSTNPIYVDTGLIIPTSIEISNDAGNSIPVSGKVAIVDSNGDWNAASKPVHVQVNNFPASVEIANDAGNSIPVSGKVAIVDQYGDWNAPDKPVYVDANISSSISIAGTPSSTTAFGESYGITITPVIQLDSIYGITDEVIQTYHNGTGSSAGANPSDALFKVECGTSLGGYGVLRSKRFIRYRPGQGALCRFTAAFTPNVANTSQRAGLFNEENGIMVGWNQSPTGPKFGVMRATGGKAHVTVLTINTAPNATQTVTLTLNGVPYSFSIGAGTTQATAAAINLHDGYVGWLTDQVDNTIVFLNSTTGPNNGAFSFTSTGNCTATFSTKQVGIAQTENWTYQDQFNVDKLNGAGPSGMTLASQYLNVYQINYRWLGAGEIRYAIENQLTGDMVFFHKEHYTNQHNTAHVANPSFKIGYVSYNLGSAANATVTGVCFMGAIEGDIRQNELNRSTSVSKSSISQNTTQHLMTVRNPYITNGKAGALNGNYILNAKEIILKDISIATQGTDPGIVYLFYDATSFTGTHSYYSQPKDNGMLSTVVGTLDPMVDTAICRFATALNGEAQYKLSDFRIAIPPGSSISIAINSTANLSRVSCALVFSED